MKVYPRRESSQCVAIVRLARGDFVARRSNADGGQRKRCSLRSRLLRIEVLTVVAFDTKQAGNNVTVHVHVPSGAPTRGANGRNERGRRHLSAWAAAFPTHCYTDMPTVSPETSLRLISTQRGGVTDVAASSIAMPSTGGQLLVQAKALGVPLPRAVTPSPPLWTPPAHRMRYASGSRPRTAGSIGSRGTSLLNSEAPRSSVAGGGKPPPWECRNLSGIPTYNAFRDPHCPRYLHLPPASTTTAAAHYGVQPVKGAVATGRRAEYTYNELRREVVRLRMENAELRRSAMQAKELAKEVEWLRQQLRPMDEEALSTVELETPATTVSMVEWVAVSAADGDAEQAEFIHSSPCVEGLGERASEEALEAQAHATLTIELDALQLNVRVKVNCG